MNADKKADGEGGQAAHTHASEETGGGGMSRGWEMQRIQMCRKDTVFTDIEKEGAFFPIHLG